MPPQTDACRGGKRWRKIRLWKKAFPYFLLLPVGNRSPREKEKAEPL